MKKAYIYILGILFLLVSFSVNAQTQTENYVVTKTYKNASKSILDTKDPYKINTKVNYFDGLGRPKQSVYVNGGAIKYGNNALIYDWSEGTPSNSGFYNLNGSSSENKIVYGSTPFGDNDLLWECVNDAASNADGGWNTDYIKVDETKAYRYTVWIKKTGNLTDGATYHGTQYVDNLDGSYNNNPYFWAGDLPKLNQWYLVVGYVHPKGYTGGSLDISGVYDTDGNKVFNGNEFKWSSSVSNNKRFRNYLYYATDTSTRQYFWNPLVQKIDGTEDSLEDILQNRNIIDNQSISAKDVVTHYEYDGFGRQDKDFLPYASISLSGDIHEDAKKATQSYYLDNFSTDFPGITDVSEVNAFSQSIHEKTELNRIIEKTAPGLAWKQSEDLVNNQEYSTGNTIKFNYDFNSESEVKYFPVNITVNDQVFKPSLGNPSFYDANVLNKTIIKDENWTIEDGKNKTTEEFKDKSGKLVLKRNYNDGKAHDTYYIYDDYGNLTYVLPPKASDMTIDQSVLDDLCYQYVYDYRNRLVEKKIPGKGWEYMVYDKLDRPVLSQDALQRKSSKWLFIKYDKLNRKIYSGEYVNTAVSGQAAMQSIVDSNLNSTSKLYEVSTSSVSNLGIYYSNNNFPQDNLTVFNVYYNNTYKDLPEGIEPPQSVFDQNITNDTHGLSTVNKVRILNTDQWITYVNYYNENAQPVYSFIYNDYLQTTDIIEKKLSFNADVLISKTTHKKKDFEEIVTVERYEYDHMGRLLSQSQKINNQISERVFRNSYSDLGKVTRKLTGNGTQKGYKDVTSGITITDDVITKTSGSCWSAGLASSGKFQADGYLEFTTVEVDKFSIVGLSSSNTDATKNTIDYGIYLIGRSGFLVVESGSNKGNFGSYQIGDTFRVERIGDKVYYSHKGVVFYVSSKLSTGELLGDMSMCHDRAKIKNLHIVDNNKGLQNVDYTYNVRDWLKHINNDGYADNDLFNYTIRYNDPKEGKALYNGNISQTSWSTASQDNSVKTYTYNYDALNRITNASDNTGNYTLKSVSYDKNGNILRLQRFGHMDSNANEFGLMDDLTYHYDKGNKLLSVDDKGHTDFGFKDKSGNDYAYDANGNLVVDYNKGVSGINYNHLNLPTRVFVDENKYIDYKYAADGTKLEKRVVEEGKVNTTYYAGNFIYHKPSESKTKLQFFGHEEGYIQNNDGKFEYVYQYEDHLGSVRLSYSDNVDTDGYISASKEIIAEDNYYPFGLKHKGYNNQVSSAGNDMAQKWGYTGKEHQDELGLDWIDITARNYNAAIGRWMNLDPLAEQMRRHSPYNYAFNNPIFFMDPDGMAPCTGDDCDKVKRKSRISEIDDDTRKALVLEIARALGRVKTQTYTDGTTEEVPDYTEKQIEHIENGIQTFLDGGKAEFTNIKTTVVGETKTEKSTTVTLSASIEVCGVVKETVGGDAQLSDSSGVVRTFGGSNENSANASMGVEGVGLEIKGGLSVKTTSYNETNYSKSTVSTVRTELVNEAVAGNVSFNLSIDTKHTTYRATLRYIDSYEAVSSSFIKTKEVYDKTRNIVATVQNDAQVIRPKTKIKGN